MIVACYRPLPLSACMVYFDLVSILFGTSIPTSFNILVKMFLHLYYNGLMAYINYAPMRIGTEDPWALTELAKAGGLGDL